jgi:hypothetical protein
MMDVDVSHPSSQHEMNRNDISRYVKFICSRIKKKAEAKGKNCHAKTMWSLEKPI